MAKTVVCAYYEQLYSIYASDDEIVDCLRIFGSKYRFWLEQSIWLGYHSDEHKESIPHFLRKSMERKGAFFSTVALVRDRQIPGGDPAATD